MKLPENGEVVEQNNMLFVKFLLKMKNMSFISYLKPKYLSGQPNRKHIFHIISEIRDTIVNVMTCFK